MVESRLIPAGVAGVAVVGQSTNSLAGRVAGPALQLGVKPVQGPARGGMREFGSLFGVMTFAARVGAMAVIADGVNLLHGFLDLYWFLQVVAVAAVFSLVAVGAGKI